MSITRLADNVEIGIITEQLPAMMQFYGELLALPYQQRMEFPGGQMERYQCGSTVIKLVTMDKHPGQRNPAGIAGGFNYLTLLVNSVSAAVDTLRQAGCPILQEPIALGGGFGFAFVTDPDGNRVELAGLI